MQKSFITFQLNWLLQAGCSVWPKCFCYFAFASPDSKSSHHVQQVKFCLSWCTTRDAAIFSCSSKSQCCNQPCLSFLTSQGGLVSIILMLYGNLNGQSVASIAGDKLHVWSLWLLRIRGGRYRGSFTRFIDARLIHGRSPAGAKIKISNIDPLPLPMTHDRTNAGNTEMWQIQIGKSQVSSNLKIPNTNPCHSTQHKCGWD